MLQVGIYLSLGVFSVLVPLKTKKPLYFNVVSSVFSVFSVFSVI